MRTFFAAAFLCAVTTSSAFGQVGQSRAALTPEQAREERAYATGIQALLWGRPLTEYLHTTHDGAKAQASYLNYFRKYSALKTAADRFVNTPNNVSIDAYSLVDLTSEPVVVNAPVPPQPRYYIVQIGDAYDEITHNIGGTNGPAPGLYLVTGPDYHGPVPPTMTQIKVRTNYATVAARVFVQGDADLPGAIDVQKGIHVLPLSVFQRGGLKYEIPKQDYAARFEFKPQGPESLREYEKLGFAMKKYLSASDDQGDPIVVSFRQIGLSVAEGFDAKSLDEPIQRGLARAVPAAHAIIDDAYAHSAEIVNGWRVTMLGGRAGGDFAVRAALASNLLGANVPEEIIYPNTRVDNQGQPLSGANKYVLRFEKGQLPPVSVFWNLAMYDDQEFFIENDFKRYSIGSTTDGLKADSDGSVTIFIQHDRPADTSNWLPAPSGSFNLTMRLYGAQPPILDGSYKLPAVRKTP